MAEMIDGHDSKQWRTLFWDINLYAKNSAGDVRWFQRRIARSPIEIDNAAIDITVMDGRYAVMQLEAEALRRGYDEVSSWSWECDPWAMNW